jgi:DNA-binding GntR family transcriptional regulator
MTPLPLGRVSTVDALVDALRARILDGDLPAGTRLVERELVEAYGVARHSLRAALRALQAEGLVRLIPNRGAHVAALEPDEIIDLYHLRTALEVEAARLALARDPAALGDNLREPVGRLRDACERPDAAWSDIVEAHAAVHRAIVHSAGAPRLAGAHAALDNEMRLFLMALKPVWTLDRMADHHEALARELPVRGEEALREHLAEGAAAVLASARPGVAGGGLGIPW